MNESDFEKYTLLAINLEVVQVQAVLPLKCHMA